MVRARAVNMAISNTDNTGLGLSINDKWIPEVDISYFFTKNIATELILTWPQKMTLNAGNTAIGSFKALPPTLLLQYHFDGLPVKPYVGAGINYTRFVSIKSKLAPSVQMSDSVGLALQAGADYWFNKQWGMFASIASVKTKSDLVAAGSTVIQTTIDFRPLVYSAGLNYRF